MLYLQLAGVAAKFSTTILASLAKSEQFGRLPRPIFSTLLQPILNFKVLHITCTYGGLPSALVPRSDVPFDLPMTLMR